VAQLRSQLPNVCLFIFSCESPRTKTRPASTNSQGTFGVLRPGSRKWSTPQSLKYSHRNSMPSNLKGKADRSKGNFIVMHMAGASPKKTASPVPAPAPAPAPAPSPAESRQNTSTLKPALRGLPNLAPKPPPLAPPHRRTTPPTSLETKREQARLLTLLRSLNPVTVVDQICTAVAFFGGIPGAPPPQNGLFPESALGNGMGSGFVAWMAEIFPSLEQGMTQQPSLPTVADGGNSAPSEPRRNGSDETSSTEGEARGNQSKASSHTEQIPSDATDLPQRRKSLPHQAQPTDSPSPPPPPPSTEVISPLPRESHEDPLEAQRTLPIQSLPAHEQRRPALGTQTPGSRKRGRPKGSKNKPKDSLTSDGPDGTPVAKRSGPGRPKGSRNRPKPPPPPATSSDQVESGVPGDLFESPAGVRLQESQGQKRPCQASDLQPVEVEENRNSQTLVPHHVAKRQKRAGGTEVESSPGVIVSQGHVQLSPVNMTDG